MGQAGDSRSLKWAVGAINLAWDLLYSDSEDA